MWAFALWGNYSFHNVGEHAGINEIVNFKSFSSSLSTLILLLGFPALDGMNKSLGQEEDCEIAEEGKTEGQCGSRTTAAVFIGSYAAITLMVLFNIYSVLISEIVSEIARFKSAAKHSDGEVLLRDVTAENNGLQRLGDVNEEDNS